MHAHASPLDIPGTHRRRSARKPNFIFEPAAHSPSGRLRENLRFYVFLSRRLRPIEILRQALQHRRAAEKAVRCLLESFPHLRSHRVRLLFASNRILPRRRRLFGILRIFRKRIRFELFRIHLDLQQGMVVFIELRHRPDSIPAHPKNR